MAFKEDLLQSCSLVLWDGLTAGDALSDREIQSTLVAALKGRGERCQRKPVFEAELCSVARAAQTGIENTNEGPFPSLLLSTRPPAPSFGSIRWEVSLHLKAG